MKHSGLTLCTLLAAGVNSVSMQIFATNESPKLAPAQQLVSQAIIKARPTTTDILTTLRADPRLSSFVAAIEKAQLTQLFGDRKFYTLFAPTNDACASLGAAWEQLLQPGKEEQLATFIKNHIVRYRYYPLAKLVAHPYVKTLAGNQVTIAKDNNGVVLNGSTHFVATHEKVRYGVIYVIDAALVPPVGPQAPVEDLPAVVEAQETPAQA